MQKTFKRYLSFFFLFLFLFPLAEKQLHVFSHLKDIHCASSDKHFHEAEHNCSICDFTSTDSAPSPENNFSFSTAELSFEYDLYRENTNSCKALYHLPSRAPPIA